MTAQVDRIPLARLYIAPENARFGAKDLGDLDALAASIVEVGDLIDPLHVYGPDEGGNFGVWDGGRRWSALMALAKGKKSKLPAALAEGVPCLITDREKAMLHSLGTFNREQMHPADEFLAYKRMFDGGMEPARIAAACAVPTPRVNQLLRLCGVAPEILDAFKAGELALDVVEAFTLSTDHDKQRAVLDAVRQRSKAPTAWMVRGAFRENAVDARDPWAKFVGREAYEAAGGTFLVDLFDREGEDWANGDLVKLLAQQKLDKLLDEVREEGWAKVEFVERNRYNWSKGYERKPGPWSADFKASACAFVRQDYNGEMKIERGYYRPTKAQGAEGAAALKPDPALFGWGHGGHHQMTAIAAEAVRVGLAKAPHAALDVTLSHIAWASLRRPQYGGLSGSTASNLHGERRQRLLGVEGSDAFQAAKEAWSDRLPADRVAFCDAVAALTEAEKAELLALTFADTLDATEGRWDGRSPDRWDHLGWIARKAGVDVAEYWTPGPEFIKGGSRDALALAARELGSKTATATDKKRDLVAYVSQRVADKKWVPKLLRDLVAAPEAPKPAKGRKAKAAPADPPPAADAGDELPPAVHALARGKAKPIKSTDPADTE